MTRPQEAEALARMAQAVIDEKYAQYERLATRGGEHFHPPAERLGDAPLPGAQPHGASEA